MNVLKGYEEKINSQECQQVLLLRNSSLCSLRTTTEIVNMEINSETVKNCVGNVFFGRNKIAEHDLKKSY